MAVAKRKTSVDLLRSSRDGDQFHYWWAARRCLTLLQPATDLVALSIEGPTDAERQRLLAGIDVIDVAEYRGTSDLTSGRIDYF